MSLAAGLLLVVAAGAASLRWLRVAQREHYLAGSVTRFEGRWLVARPVNLALGLVTAALVVAGGIVPVLWLPAAVGLVAWPIGLSLRGRTSRLAWTRRLRTLAAVTAVVALAVVALAAALGAWPVGVVVVGLVGPQLVDLSAWVLAPVERRLLQPFVTRAQARLAQVSPDVVAITGSYGKTTTKGYLKALLAQQFEVCASPASYNNTAGLARTINEHLHPGAEILVAEMGMYDVGEIAAMCAWIRPRVGVITAIGPVHLERVGTIERVVQAKREILDTAEVAVLNVDDPRLAALADEVATTRKVVRCGSATPDLDVAVRPSGAGSTDPDADPTGPETAPTRVVVEAAGQRLEVDVAEGTHLTNLACAVGAALAMGFRLEGLAAGVASIEPPAHRGTVEVNAAGISVIDDTFNANPLGAQHGLDALAGLAVTGRRVVVTPGMVELGPRQDPENEAFARAAAQAADTLIVVKRTNRRALVRGASGGSAQVLTVDDRDQAVAWVRDQLSPGDAVLYENDLPDHFV